jgi:hypothetical protein
MCELHQIREGSESRIKVFIYTQEPRSALRSGVFCLMSHRNLVFLNVLPPILPKSVRNSGNLFFMKIFERNSQVAE